MEKEYASLRDEILKWQDRRITFTQTGVTLITAYTGYLLSLPTPKEAHPVLTWPVVSLLPLLITSLLLNIARLFELFQLRAAAFLVVFHESPWETHVSNAPSQLIWKWKPGYNATMAVLYLAVAVASVVILLSKYPAGTLLHWILFGCFALLCGLSFWLLFRFKSDIEKRRYVIYWESVRPVGGVASVEGA